MQLIRLARTKMEQHLKQTKILKIHDIKLLHLALYFYKNNMNNLADYRGNHNYLTRYRDNLRPIIHRTTNFRRSFLFQSVALWERLSINYPNIVAATSINKFKRLLKSQLILGIF